MTEPSSTATRIAAFAEEHSDYTAIAFDNDGKIIDWKTSGDWVNGSHEGERIHVVDGDITAEAVQHVLDS
ncbi:hypothetical protein [Williamsia sp. 1135]|uniref:hypothetical protein n=1 Tax=Williamsia sp. 1135 TaxID=1889262 RepID=UPI000A111D8A|nr:hypothetical protein [Williamsia sp. 1135]ORM37697.1 hypothetical protein BFL43_03265 [Williamsia sp. 1135]